MFFAYERRTPKILTAVSKSHTLYYIFLKYLLIFFFYSTILFDTLLLKHIHSFYVFKTIKIKHTFDQNISVGHPTQYTLHILHVGLL